jgi:hypothetical protein
MRDWLDRAMYEDGHPFMVAFRAHIMRGKGQTAMTEDELQAIEARVEAACRLPVVDMVADWMPDKIVRTDVPKLVAEVRRLRAALHGAADVMPAQKFRDICSSAGLDDAETKAIFLGQGMK